MYLIPVHTSQSDCVLRREPVRQDSPKPGILKNKSRKSGVSSDVSGLPVTWASRCRAFLSSGHRRIS
jgi:hypothetical protein